MTYVDDESEVTRQFSPEEMADLQQQVLSRMMTCHKPKSYRGCSRIDRRKTSSWYPMV